MSFLRTHFLALALVGVALPAAAAGADDLDPKVLVADTGSCGKAKVGNGPSDTIEFQALGGSMALEGAKNLCFGNTSISQVAVAAPGVAPVTSGSSTPPAVVGASGGGGGGGGGGSSASQAALSNFSSSGTGTTGATTSPSGGSTSSSSTFFGGGGGSSGGSNVGAPGPEAGAGLPFLIVAGAYAFVRRRRARARA